MVNRNEKDESKRNTISLSPRAMNRIIDLVNSKIPKEKCVFRSDEEERFYDNLINEAKETLDRIGVWPIFDVCELDYDDPALDIYPEGSLERHLEERRKKRESKW